MLCSDSGKSWWWCLSSRRFYRGPGSGRIRGYNPAPEKPTGGTTIWDTLFMRPIGVVATAVGSVAWVVSYPFAYWGGNTNESTQMLVATPFEWTFERPLGEF